MLTGNTLFYYNTEFFHPGFFPVPRARDCTGQYRNLLFGKPGSRDRIQIRDKRITAFVLKFVALRVVIE
jgi:hypothetical protein